MTTPQQPAPATRLELPTVSTDNVDSLLRDGDAPEVRPSGDLLSVTKFINHLMVARDVDTSATWTFLILVDKRPHRCEKVYDGRQSVSHIFRPLYVRLSDDKKPRTTVHVMYDDKDFPMAYVKVTSTLSKRRVYTDSTQPMWITGRTETRTMQSGSDTHDYYAHDYAVTNQQYRDAVIRMYAKHGITHEDDPVDVTQELEGEVMPTEL